MRLGLSILAAIACMFGGAANAPAAKYTPKIKHVFTIVLENKNYEETFGEAATEAPYLARKLPAKGQLLSQYHGTGHFSLGNYLTMISGQSENPTTQTDCQSFNEFAPGTIGADGQALGAGCVYPPQVLTVADQLEAAGKSWRGYMQDMGNDLSRDGSATCSHPAIGTADGTQKATATDQYATRHDPFVYFHSVIDDAAGCAAHVVNLKRLRHDLRKPKRTRSYSFITPDLCSDGHDEECANPSQRGGYPGIDDFLRKWVPRIRQSKAFKRNGLLIVTFDESESGADACCFVPQGPNALLQGINGPGGGHTGAVLLSPFIKHGTVDETPYNHYDYLHTVEDIFGLRYLGYAAQPQVRRFAAIR